MELISKAFYSIFLFLDNYCYNKWLIDTNGTLVFILFQKINHEKKNNFISTVSGGIFCTK